MSDHPLLPSLELTSAVLWPLRVGITALIAVTLPLVLFWCICVTLYYTSWNHETGALQTLFEAAVKSTDTAEPFAHMRVLAMDLPQWLHKTLFLRSGLQDLLQGPPSNTPMLAGSVRAVSELVGPSFNVVVLSTQVFGVRAALLIGMLPLLLLGYALAYADGSAERSIRRACAGRESANLYHRAKYFQVGVLGALLISALCLPVHIAPTWLLLCASATIGVLARVQWTYYKKYL